MFFISKYWKCHEGSAILRDNDILYRQSNSRIYVSERDKNMRYLTFDVKNDGSQEYAALYLYLLEDFPAINIRKRPMVIVCPGGGYAYTSDREAEIVALQFCAMGYHAAVLRYSAAPAVFPAAVLEVGKSVALIRENAAEWFVDPEKIAVLGFSAGGHLAASYCTHWDQDWVAESLEKDQEILRPNAMILGYPVITSGEFGHQGSFKNLLGEKYEEKKDELSLEKCVTKNTPKAFIWHTCADAGVPVQNSLFLVDALLKNQIPVEYHIFEKGGHGLSLANRLTGCVGNGPERAAEEWIHLVHRWMENWIAE